MIRVFYTISYFREDFKKKPFEKKVDILYNFRASAIKAKEYKGFGNVYNFMLEEVHDFGVTNMGKFGSLNKDAIDLLYKRIRDEVMQKRKEVSKFISSKCNMYLSFIFDIFHQRSGAKK